MNRKRFSKEFKAKVALEAIRGHKTSAELTSEYGVHTTQIGSWKKQALQAMPELFSGKGEQQAIDHEVEKSQLYEQIGKLQMELQWLKKKVESLELSVETKRTLIEPSHPQISIRHQCELLGLNRASWYNGPVEGQESSENLELMHRIDEEYTCHPFYGSRRITTWLNRQGYAVNRKRVQRLMGLMGLQGVAPGPNTSQGHPKHKIYPYLLRDLAIDHADQVWCSDITYIRLRRGFVYLVAIMDWYSRYVLSWQLSTTMEADFCVEALERALRLRTPGLFNTDQGSQFTSLAFTGMLQDHEVEISMDGKGRCWDNIFIERLWRNVKYEDIYLKHYDTVDQVRRGLGIYFSFYNTNRPHQGLSDYTPEEVYTGQSCPLLAA